MLTSHMSAIEDRLLASFKISGNTGHGLHKGSPRAAQRQPSGGIHKGVS